MLPEWHCMCIVQLCITWAIPWKQQSNRNSLHHSIILPWEIANYDDIKQEQKSWRALLSMSSSFSSSKPIYFTKYNIFTLIVSHRKKLETPKVSPVNRRTNIIYRISFTSKNKDKGIPGGRVFLIHCLIQEILALALASHLESTPSHLVSAVELW